MNNSVLHTARLALRPLTADDLELVLALNSDPQVMAPLGGSLSPAAASAWVERQIAHFREHGYGRYVVSRGRDFVGLVGLSRTDFESGIVPGVEVAWRLALEHWGRGYATEAARAAIEEGFVHYGLEQVIAVTSVGNVRSRRVMARLGMTHSEQDDFDHPKLAAGDPLRRHVVYRLSRSAR